MKRLSIKKQAAIANKRNADLLAAKMAQRKALKDALELANKMHKRKKAAQKQIRREQRAAWNARAAEQSANEFLYSYGGRRRLRPYRLMNRTARNHAIMQAMTKVTQEGWATWPG